MKRFLFSHIILLFSVLAWAQGTSVATGLPYECSFEESENLSAWTLNYGTPNATDKWMYGTAVHSTGRRSLYPSSDGVNPVYGKNPNITVAYLTYKFPTATSIQKYDVSFDWKGVGDSITSRLYVLFCREQDLTATGATNLDAIVNAPNARLSNDQMRACQSLGESGEKFVCGSVTWQNVSFTNEVSVSAINSQRNFVFVFIWVNENSADTARITSIAIDNFQINTAAIKKPENLTVYPQCEDSSLIAVWDGKNGSTFDVQYRKLGELSWTHTFGDVSEESVGFSRDGTICTYALKPILEGTYEVRVRGKNDGLVTNYTYATNILVYCPENHCINYINIHDTTKVKCTYGYRYDYHQGSTPYDNVGIIDFGPDAMESRHTLHVDPTEVDPRTDSLLHTVPAGAMASVRLGNWNTGGEAESITYDITVDTASQGILIVKYAVVLEHPGSTCGDPGFNMVILDEHGQEVGGTCGKADFSYSSAKDAGWNQTTKGDDVVWKDWTTVGVNLMQYHGQTLKVRFTTNDCGAGGHYGYAYFTLDCANAHIETDNCGTDAYVSCTAPEGFAYMWYKNGDPDSVVSHDQTLEVEAARTQYTCRVSFVEEPDCWFEISTTSEPRFPVPEYSFERVYGDCQAKIQFTNTSHVMNKADGHEHHTSERCNDCRWEFRNLTTGQSRITTAWSPLYVASGDGDTIEVTLTTYIGANNSCDSTSVDTIIMPNIYPESSEFRYTTCSESPILFDGKWFDTDTIYTARTPNFAGCDSLATLYLKVYPSAKDTYRHDSICSDGSVTIDGIKYNQPVEDLLIMMKTVHGCDSALYLTLTVNDRLSGTVEPIPYACADGEQLFINFDFQAGQYDSVEIVFTTPDLRDTTVYENVSTVSIPYPETILPGHYKATLTFYQYCCGTRVEEREFDVLYRSSIVEQKWNDVLTLLAPAYNGGYEFVDFQWFKNGLPIEGETHSYLYQPLDMNAEYFVVVTRKDGVRAATCPIQPVHHEQQSEYPTIVPSNQVVRLKLNKPTKAYIYSALGQLVSTHSLWAGDAVFETPAQTGIYIIRYEED